MDENEINIIATRKHVYSKAKINLGRELENFKNKKVQNILLYKNHHHNLYLKTTWDNYLAHSHKRCCTIL